MQPGNQAGRRDRLAAATAEDMEPLAVCRQCGSPVAIFLAHGLRWQRFRGNSATLGTPTGHSRTAR